MKLRNGNILGFLMVTSLLGSCSSEPTRNASDLKATRQVEKSIFNSARAWQQYEQELRLFYAYLDQQDFDVDIYLNAVKKKALSQTSASKFRQVLQRSGYAFTDPHFMVGPLDDDDYNVFPTSADLAVHWDGERYLIKEVRQNSDALNAGLKPGQELVSIDGTPISEAVTELGDMLTAMSPRQKSYAATLIANGKRGAARQISVKMDDVILKQDLANPRELARRVNEMKMIEVSDLDGVVHIIINNQLGNNDLIKAFDEVIENAADSDALILDLRNTPSGGNSEVGRSIIGHFVESTESFQVHERPSLEREFTVPRRFVEQVKPRTPQYTKPFVVLSGKWTGSMGEGIVIGLDAAADAYTICSDMGDLLGAMGRFGIRDTDIRISYANESLFHVDGTPREDFICDVNLPSGDIDENGNDPALAAAMNYLKSIQ